MTGTMKAEPRKPEPWKWTQTPLGEKIVLWGFIAFMCVLGLYGISFIVAVVTPVIQSHTVHTQQTPVLMDGNWLVGEYRTCSRVGVPFVCPKNGETAFGLAEKPESNSHILDVRYEGKLDLTENVSWHCQRREESVECDSPIDLSAGLVKK